MGNFIKEAKIGFYFDKTDSPRFLENHVRMTIHSIRLKFLKVASKLV